LAALSSRGSTTGEPEIIQGATIVTLAPVDQLRGAPLSAGESLPHLDWVFVSWTEQRHGIGTMLLRSVVSELRALGYSTLASTVMTGNAPPMLWHWSNGFRLPRDG
jgi:GNAT superfamily N-acetyltransferase